MSNTAPSSLLTAVTNDTRFDGYGTPMILLTDIMRRNMWQDGTNTNNSPPCCCRFAQMKVMEIIVCVPVRSIL